MSVSSSEAWLDQEIASRPLTVLVFFRGEWCPFCQSYLREINKQLALSIRRAGGELFGVTARPSAVAASIRRGWALGYDVVADESNALARRFGVAITPHAATPLAGDPSAYPHGMAQPAVIALDGHGQVSYRWAIDPSTTNLGGATDRPLPAEIWAAIEAALGGASGPAPRAERLDAAFLERNYPENHAAFLAWVASSRA